MLLDDHDGGGGQAGLRHSQHQPDDVRNRHLRPGQMPVLPRNLRHSPHNRRRETHKQYIHKNITNTPNNLVISLFSQRRPRGIQPPDAFAHPRLGNDAGTVPLGPASLRTRPPPHRHAGSGARHRPGAQRRQPDRRDVRGDRRSVVLHHLAPHAEPVHRQPGAEGSERCGNQLREDRTRAAAPAGRVQGGGREWRFEFHCAAEHVVAQLPEDDLRAEIE